MTEKAFAQRWAGEGRCLSCCEAGSGRRSSSSSATESFPGPCTFGRTAACHRVRDNGGGRVAARSGATDRGRRRRTSSALWLALAPEADIGCVVAADGLPDEAFRGTNAISSQCRTFPSTARGNRGYRRRR